MCLSPFSALFYNSVTRVISKQTNIHSLQILQFKCVNVCCGGGDGDGAMHEFLLPVSCDTIVNSIQTAVCMLFIYILLCVCVFRLKFQLYLKFYSFSHLTSTYISLKIIIIILSISTIFCSTFSCTNKTIFKYVYMYYYLFGFQ